MVGREWGHNPERTTARPGAATGGVGEPEQGLNERETLLATVLDTPDDDTARLVFADWLEANSEQSFGRFLRAGIVAAKYHHAGVIEEREFYDAVKALAEVSASGEPGQADEPGQHPRRFHTAAFAAPLVERPPNRLPC